MKRKTRVLGGQGLFYWLLLVAVQALPASAALTKFGSRLSTDDSQPQAGQFCSDDHQNELHLGPRRGISQPGQGEGAAGRDLHPVDQGRGLVAGTFRLFDRMVPSRTRKRRRWFALARPSATRVAVTRCRTTIETFNVNVHVNKGDYSWLGRGPAASPPTAAASRSSPTSHPCPSAAPSRKAMAMDRAARS